MFKKKKKKSLQNVWKEYESVECKMTMMTIKSYGAIIYVKKSFPNPHFRNVRQFSILISAIDH